MMSGEVGGWARTNTPAIAAMNSDPTSFAITGKPVASASPSETTTLLR